MMKITKFASGVRHIAKFSAKNCYLFLINGGVYHVIGKMICRLPISEKNKLFGWLAHHNRILTTENLKEKGELVDPLCKLCYSCNETVDHLLLNCPYFIAWSSIT